jgi:esterase/lipase
VGTGVRRGRQSSPHSFLSALELIDEVKALVPGIFIPCLILQGKLDTVVEPRDATWLHDHLDAAWKSLVILPRSDHVVAVARGRKQVVALTREFVLSNAGDRT